MRLAGRRAGATIFSSVASAHGNLGGLAWTSHEQLALWTSCELAFGIRDSENLIGNHVSVRRCAWPSKEGHQLGSGE